MLGNVAGETRQLLCERQGPGACHSVVRCRRTLKHGRIRACREGGNSPAAVGSDQSLGNITVFVNILFSLGGGGGVIFNLLEKSKRARRTHQHMNKNYGRGLCALNRGLLTFPQETRPSLGLGLSMWSRSGPRLCSPPLPTTPLLPSFLRLMHATLQRHLRRLGYYLQSQLHSAIFTFANYYQ